MCRRMLSLFIKVSIAAMWLTPAWCQPAILANGVVNATGYQTKLTPNSVFVIFGNLLGGAALATAAAPDYPTALAGTSVTFTPVRGTAINARLIYTIAGQIAGLLPSSIVPGTYAVRVTYNGQTSAPQDLSLIHISEPTRLL